MRASRMLIAALALAGAVAALPMPSATADPVNSKGVMVTPRATDIVGVGSGLLQNLFDQFSHDYNATAKASAPHLYSWDAINPATGLANDLIQTKAGCAKIARPDGSAAGIKALSANVRDPVSRSNFCIDFARSALADPSPRLVNTEFVALGKDAVTWAVNATTNAPRNLTTAELARIYTCAVTNWKQVGGKNAPIDAQLPQTSSDTRTLFLTALGGGTPIKPGRCVDRSTNESPDNLPGENEGVNKYLQGPDVIYPYSIGTYLAEVFRSGICLNASCAPVHDVTCHATKSQLLFGCDTASHMTLGCVDNISPTVGQGASQTTNPGFSPAFVDSLFLVTRWAKGTAGNIPGYLEGIFGQKGWVSTSSVARTDLRNYGFLAVGAKTLAGLPSRFGCGD